MSTGSSSSPVTTQTQTKDPWSGAQPFLSSMYNVAEQYQQGQVGYLPYSGPTQAELDPTLVAALGGIQTVAGQQISGGPGLGAIGAAQGLGGYVIGNQGITPGVQQGLDYMTGAANTLPGINAQYQNAIDTTIPTLSAQYQNDLNNWLTQASAYGQAGLGQAGQQYQDIYNQNAAQNNPYLEQAIADQNRIALEKVQSSMSGAGRYGSGMYSDAAARAQAEIADPILAQDYAQRQQNMLAASQGLAGTGASLGALYSGLGQLQTQGEQAQAGLIGLGGQFGAQQASLAGLQGQFGQNIAGLYNQGLAAAGQWGQAMPGLMQAEYMPEQMLTNVGQFYQDRAQQDLAGQIAFYNASQAYPWQQLERQSAIMAGAGQLGGTTVTQQTPVSASMPQRLLGGALVGAGLGNAIPGVGSGLGAIGGAATAFI